MALKHPFHNKRQRYAKIVKAERLSYVNLTDDHRVIEHIRVSATNEAADCEKVGSGLKIR